MFRKKKTPKPTSPVDYPAGTFVHSEKGYFYIVSPSKRYRLISERVVASWRPHRIVETTEAALSKYKVAAKMKFRNGSLIHSLTSGRIYLIVETKRCQVINPDAFERLGLGKDEAVTVSNDEINLHEVGEAIN